MDLPYLISVSLPSSLPPSLPSLASRLLITFVRSVIERENQSLASGGHNEPKLVLSKAPARKNSAELTKTTTTTASYLDGNAELSGYATAVFTFVLSRLGAIRPSIR